ncbi:agmatinase family protein [Cytophagales bacterium LB-30]|uniref:Agmatinase family protein n=1 Tax=Shiella aurantiaca TaxID=3058365 RepID=A0ABT8F1L6_9BACT|nr:agmatinase family protein [Shiella aurantiaca]MDN4164320.1 agmatinase family protein [Shiella aurantiaca]
MPNLDQYDPSGVGLQGSLFGLPFQTDDAQLVVIPVPWDVTVSYADGAALGPEAVLGASSQVDLYVDDIPDAWKLGISMLPISEKWAKKSKKWRKIASQYIDWLENGSPKLDRMKFAPVPRQVDEQAEKLNEWVKETALEHIKTKKMVCLLGGDHSTPLGIMQAMAETHGKFGILQIDAHADLREAYEGFTYSHASIMYNALKIKEVAKLVQVGIRDYCQEEAELSANSKGRVTTFYDKAIKESQYEGKTWRQWCDEIIAELPDKVYISFDIDGLDPKLCPHTGTPVAGGFELEQVMYLFKQVVLSGKKIIGFDLNEVAPGEDEWDGNVGARALYRMCNLMAVSQGKLKLKK